MQNPWWKQFLIGLVLFLAGYFMFGGADLFKKKEDKLSSSALIQVVQA